MSFTRFRSAIAGLLQIVVVVALLVTAAVFSQGPSEEDVLADTGLVESSSSDATLAQVKVIQPRNRDVRVSVESTGTIQARALVRLIPQVSGRVTSISDNLRAGGSFEANELLLTIDDQDFKLQLEQAKANLASAKANLELQQAESDSATANWKLLNPSTTAPPLVAKTPQMKITSASIELAQVQVKTAELNLRRAQFSLPFPGRVIDNDAAIGQFISVGQSFGSVYDAESVEVVIPLSYDELARIEPAKGRQVNVQSNGLTGVAIVDRVSAQLDSRSRVATIYATLPANPKFLPGSFVSVKLEGKLHRSILVLPENTEQSYESFWIVRAGKLERATPEVYARMPQGLIVENFDFAQGIVVGSVPNAAPGQAVKPVAEKS